MRAFTRTLIPLVLGLTFVAMPTSSAEAADKGFRLELGPDFSYNRATNNVASSWTAGASLGIEGWGAGPIGIMFHLSEGMTISDVKLTDQGLTPTVTYTTELDIGPTVNAQAGPVHFRVGAGPWFGYSNLSEESVSKLSAENFAIDWNQAGFLGILGSARLDLNVPLISPFFIIEGRRPVGVSTTEADAGPGRELKGTAGLRLNLIPFVKLGLSGFAAYSRGGHLDPVLLEANQGQPLNFGQYGAQLWLVVAL